MNEIFTSNLEQTENSCKNATPRKSTIDFIRLFAKVYTYVGGATGLGNLIIN